MVCSTLEFQSVCEIADFRDVFKCYAYFVNNRLFLTTAKLALPDLAKVCKVDTSNINPLKEAGE